MNKKNRFGLPNTVPCHNPLCEDGMCKQHTCAVCNGLGVVEEETGQAIPPEIGYPALRRMIRNYRTHCQHLAKQIPPRIPAEPDRYAGARKVGGAVYRMD
ncbi:MAG: hypothetical protein OIF57_17465 [Marinobacterium sp.]|nr:hypothetical protein [Marinobacterium sp.]